MRRNTIIWGYGLMLVSFALLGGCGGATMSRSEFQSSVIGKTKEEIIEIVGRPDRTSDIGDGNSTWTYDWKTMDPVTGNKDRMTVIQFAGERAVNVMVL